MTTASRFNLFNQLRKDCFLHYYIDYFIQFTKTFEKTQKFDSTPTDNLTEYDTQSIMHYDGLLRGFFPKSNPIMTDRITGQTIGINREMSQLDIKKINEMYPCPVRGKFSNIFAFFWL